MKKMLAIIVIMALLMVICMFSLSACRGATEENVLIQEIRTVDETECSAFTEALPYLVAPEFSEEDDGTTNIVIKIYSDDVSMYGNKIFDALTAAEKTFEEYNLEIVFISGESVSFLFNGDLDFATLTDGRSGKSETSLMFSVVEDLAKEFPAMNTIINAEENGVSEEEYRMYDTIMNALSSDLSRSEDDIIEELAPSYGMTAFELKDWLFEMMGKIYG